MKSDQPKEGSTDFSAHWATDRSTVVAHGVSQCHGDTGNPFEGITRREVLRDREHEQDGLRQGSELIFLPWTFNSGRLR